MPELLTTDGKQIDAARADEINASFDAAMNDDSPGPAAPPRKQPPAAPEESQPRAKRARQPRDDKARVTPRPAAASLTDDQRHQGAKGLAQVTAGVAMVAAQATGNLAFTADAVTIVSHSDALADACVQTAKASPAFAAALDKVCAAGPYAAMIGVGVAIVSQLARNHKPSLPIPGTVHPDELLSPPAPEGQEQPEDA
jgi:hypothetical protein